MKFGVNQNLNKMNESFTLKNNHHPLSLSGKEEENKSQEDNSLF